MEKAGSNRLRGWIRTAWAAAGLGWFFWLGYEDSDASIVVLLAGLLCLAAGVTLLARSRALGSTIARDSGATRSVVTAGLFGVAVGPVAVLLMVVKTGLHGHIPPDFNTQDVLNVLQRSPIWAVAGGLLGLAWWLRVKATSPQSGR